MGLTQSFPLSFEQPRKTLRRHPVAVCEPVLGATTSCPPLGGGAGDAKGALARAATARRQKPSSCAQADACESHPRRRPMLECQGCWHDIKSGIVTSLRAFSGAGLRAAGLLAGRRRGCEPSSRRPYSPGTAPASSSKRPWTAQSSGMVKPDASAWHRHTWRSTSIAAPRTPYTDQAAARPLNGG